MTLANSKLLRTVLGLAIITAAFLAGDFAKRQFGLILPGSVLGMFVLLILLGARLVRLEWVEDAAKLLIFILPVCFVTLYVRAGADQELWQRWGFVIAGTLIVSVVVLWAFVGRLAQWLLAKSTEK
ncbi:CidA/LrgA family protein [Oleiharenicola lentus]|uniref:CidA/LrgA family protein n=1 Tax=Oleiharenicola lentus TaxID=2508720 RepID=UPI003F66802D